MRRRRRDDRFAARRRLRGAGPRLPLGHGHVPPHAAAARVGAGRAEGTLERSSSARARERRHAQPVRRPAHVDGHHRLRDAQGVPEGRGHGGAVAADRGQGAPASPGRRDGPVTRARRVTCSRTTSSPRRRLRRAVRAADRPARPRSARLLRDRALHDAAAEMLAQRPRGSSSRAARRRCTSTTHRRSTPPSTSRRPGARHLLRRAARRAAARWRAPHRRRRVRPHGHASPDAGGPLFDLPRDEQIVWMSHGDAIADRARRVRRHRATGRPSPRSRTVTRRLRRAVPSRGRAHGAARSHRASSSTCAAAAHVDEHLDHRESVARIRAGRRASVICGCRVASTPRSPPRSCTRPSATSSPACSSTPAAAPRRGRAGGGDVPRSSRSTSCT